jgi:hypothetical protein
MSLEGLNEREQKTLVAVSTALVISTSTIGCTPEENLRSCYEMQNVSVHLLAQQMAVHAQRGMTPVERQQYFKTTMEKLMVLTRVYEKSFKEQYGKHLDQRTV